MSYSFDQYTEETEFTRKANGTVHNTIGYGLLGLIGEMGEVVETVDFKAEGLLSDEESEALELFQEFLILAKKIESFKKAIRKEQICLFAEATLNEKATEELGGTLWYMNNLAEQSGLSLGKIAQANQQMLYNRFNANPGWMTNGGVKTH